MHAIFAVFYLFFLPVLFRPQAHGGGVLINTIILYPRHTQLKYLSVCYHNRPANNQSTIFSVTIEISDIKHVYDQNDYVIAVWL